jgi:invasion protein IalB
MENEVRKRAWIAAAAATLMLLGGGSPAAAQATQQPTRAAPPASPAPGAPQPTSAPAAAAAPASAAPAAPSAQAARTWSVTCAEPEQPDGSGECRLSASATMQPQNRRLLTVLLLRQPETRSLAMVFNVAHGVALPAGLGWQIDEGELQRIAFQNSDPDGVYVGIPVADELLTALRRGAALRVSFVLASRREGVTVALPLTQFNEASTEFFAAERQRSR